MARTPKLDCACKAKRRAIAACLSVAAASVAGIAQAQTFNSGSTGADGALDLTGTPSGTVVDFNPKTMHVSTNPNAFIDPEGDNVFHFTTITIPAGVTLKMWSKYLSGPVYLLAQGAVDVAGTIDLNGENGQQRSNSTATRRPAFPGPGGFLGGIAGNYSSTPQGSALPGGGPGGGIAPNGFDPSTGNNGPGYGGKLTATPMLVPLIGGSGGGGGSSNEYQVWGSGGGAGGGALLIASGVSINLSGTIYANGGAGGSYDGVHGGCQNYAGGGGAGGSVRLVARVLQGSGRIEVYGNGGNTNNCRSAPWVADAGVVRLEAFQQNWGYAIPYGNYYQGSPLNSFVPTTPPPTIQVVSVAGQTVPANPTGSFDLADVTINSGPTVPVEIVIKAHYVPAGTIPTLYLFSLEGKDQQVASPALLSTGTPGETQSIITVDKNVTFPPGFSRGYVRASWTAGSGS
jgi:hypothetical protein